jgi:hypothetical protein
MYTYLPQMHKLSFETTFSSTPLQQRLLQHCYNTVFTTLSLQHCFLQHHFNTAFATSSSTPLLLLNGGKV